MSAKFIKDIYEKKFLVILTSAENIEMSSKELGEREFQPILDPHRSKLLGEIKDKFRMQFKKFSFSYVCEALIDDKEAIVVFMDQSEETSVHLPAKFEGFPVFISYEVFQLG
ncbi:hypothetical protein GLOIN_2v1778635 [Rhizophagus irregularis DAOM 181602=DAOM 197198]|uniref:Uncharacterized protein n=1 Tax=Rhizophagus irregularis (strain DAOM 181602 / DAOM 197198 / MUCL 43194) TaxID=747089 RepID=A0A2P4PRX6_RHIID|nr:hypothetical protein GLOIN_2v1778635 [Rhizophagus irregularis DAOM 181602=DAOM 197198]POG68126.1 hypothetical protein GLOIN_2v1778635 [Rhizophagus irregularis DAOM 181602=DAOM 197198]|eukprot:XP_025174992.1 hypothetical protein GLOIN_2v1778635 [Rhizophagus irregularis DAOM 181602=DAOM 197198]